MTKMWLTYFLFYAQMSITFLLRTKMTAWYYTRHDKQCVFV